MSAARISPYAPIDQEGHGDLRCPCRSFPAAVVLRRFRLPCTVRNPLGIRRADRGQHPALFSGPLCARHSEGWRKPCHIVWRDERLIGVTFATA